jgi:hypothetical protein
VIDLTRVGFGVQKSSISRGFVRAATAQVKALAERRFDGMYFPVIMIDGIKYAGETMIVAAGIPRPPEAPRRVGAAALRGVPSGELRDSQGVVGIDGEVGWTGSTRTQHRACGRAWRRR